MKQYPFDKATVLAGNLYGNLLGRVADKAGFDSIVEHLTVGNRSLNKLVEMMLTSEEFRENYLMNNTPNEVAKQLRIQLLKEIRPTASAIKETAIAILEHDWREVVVQMINSEAYVRAFGDDRIPFIKYS